MAKGWYYYHIYRDYETALAEYRLAAEQYPRNPDIFFATAAVYRRQGNFEKALELFHESFLLDPRNPSIPKEIGITLSHLHRFDEAVQYMDLALQIDPDYRPAYNQKVWMWWMGKGSARETREWVYDAPRAKPGDYRWLRFYQEFYEHDYHAALARLDSIKQSNKEDARWFETGYVYKAMGEHAKALAVFDSARQRLEGLLPERDSDYGIHMSLAKAYAALGWKDKAYKQIALAQQDQKLTRDSLYVNSFRRQKAQIHLLLGEHEQALNILASQLQKRTNFTIQWVLLNPNWKPIWNHPRFLEIAREYNIGNTFAFKNP
jgi:tetratricopeptide (TPR) repeat protein